MFKSTFSLLALAIFSSVAAAQGNANASRVGYTGTLSSLDGGLGGTVRVVDTTTLQITDYTLKDASAPALYWWGTNDGVIKNGFRISSKQVTEAATTNTLDIKLDVGKTSADFSTVGLWCEKLSANFGQAALMAPDGSSSTSGTATMTGSAAAATTSSAKSAGANLVSSHGDIVAAFVAAVGFAVWMG